MRKGTRLTKRIVALLLVLLLSIESFGAVVSDNDGSAFITKAEFDSLKNNFQSQIDQYNTSIDSKIDGAIASYLAGIKVGKEPENLVDQIVATKGDKITWVYTLPGTGTNIINNGLTITSTGSLYYYMCSNLYYHMGAYAWHDDVGLHHYNLVSLVFGTGHTFHPGNGWDSWKYADYKNNTNANWSETASSNLTYFSGNISQANYAYYSQSVTDSAVSSSGSGFGWIAQWLNNKYVLKYYCNTLFPQIDIKFQVHLYKSFPVNTSSSYIGSNGFTFTSITQPTYSAPNVKLGESVSVGNQKSETDTTSDIYTELSANLIKTNDGNNYLNVVWGVDANTMIYWQDEDYIGKQNTTKSTVTVPTTLKYQNKYYNSMGIQSFQTSFPSWSQDYYGISYENKYSPLRTFANDILSSKAGENVYIGDGCPVIEAIDDTEKINGKIKLIAQSGMATCRVLISDKKFDNGNIATGAKELANFDVQTGTETNFELKDVEKGVLYMYVKNTTTTSPIIIDSFTIT